MSQVSRGSRLTSRGIVHILLRMVLNASASPAPTEATGAGLVSLDRLPVGKAAIVRSISGEAPEMLRLRVMGLCVGHGVHTLRQGTRLIVCVGGTRLGLDSRVAASVQVEPVPDTAPCQS